jgi:hypothetical protein
VRRAAARHRRGHRLHPRGRPPSSARRSPRSWTVSPSSRRSQYGRRGAGETVARWSSRWRATFRVLVIKLADRLHNARTWRHLRAEKPERRPART